MLFYDEKDEIVPMTNRVEYIDLLKAFGIIAMIMGHVGFGSIFAKWIHCFHMPMFFIISGYFFKDTTFNKLISKKGKTLLLPYFSIGVLHLIVYFAVYGFDVKVIYSLFWENTNGNMPISGALWFLTAMFISELVFWMIHRLKLSVLWTTAVAAIIACIGMTCATYLPFRLPFAFDAGIVGVGLLQIGYLLKDKLKRLIELSLPFAVGSLILFSAIGLIHDYVSLKKGLYGVWPLFWICAVGITISLWNISKYIYDWASSKKRLSAILQWIIGIGRDSIIYLCFNQIVIKANRRIIGYFIDITSNDFVLLCVNIIILIISMFELYIIQQLIMRTKLKVFVGK